MVNYLSDLQPWYQSTIDTLEVRDRKDFTEAMSHVLCCVPFSHLSSTLNEFVQPIGGKLASLSSGPLPSDSKARKDLEGSILDAMDQINTLFSYVTPEIPLDASTHPCVEFFKGLWPIFHSLYQLYPHGAIPLALNRCLRNLIISYSTFLGPLLPEICSLIVTVLSSRETFLFYSLQKFSFDTT